MNKKEEKDSVTFVGCVKQHVLSNHGHGLSEREMHRFSAYNSR